MLRKGRKSAQGPQVQVLHRTEAIHMFWVIVTWEVSRFISSSQHLITMSFSSMIKIYALKQKKLIKIYALKQKKLNVLKAIFLKMI